jgi:hypothetical protein
VAQQEQQIAELAEVNNKLMQERDAAVADLAARDAQLASAAAAHEDQLAAGDSSMATCLINWPYRHGSQLRKTRL